MASEVRGPAPNLGRNLLEENSVSQASSDPSPSDVFAAIAQELTDLDGPFHHATVEQVNPSRYVGRVYPADDEEYEGFSIAFE